MTTQLYDLLSTKYPFGRGATSTTLSSDPHTRRTATGTVGTKNLILNNPAYADGDIICIHQSVKVAGGTTENWEVNQVSSGGGSTSLGLLNNLGRTYTTGTQVLDVKEYLNLTMGNYAGTAWNGSIGGLNVLAIKGTLTLSGAPNINGGAGSATSTDNRGGATGGGFRGGNNSTDASMSGTGEGHDYATSGTWPVETAANQGNGAGGAVSTGSGASGGNASAGTVGTSGALGGALSGNASLSSIFFGGGASGARSDGSSAGGGGAGGGIWIIWAKSITISGSLKANGGLGGNGNSSYDGGSGAGGCILLNTQYGTLGAGLVTAIGGTAVGSGPAGSTGRIRVNYSSTLEGTTSPSASTYVDSKLKEPSGMIQII